MTLQLLQILRDYLLTFDDSKRVQVRNELKEKDLKFISEIELSFLNDTHIGDIITQFSLSSFQKEIKELHLDFFLELAERYSDGETNQYIDVLLASDNQTFKKTILLFPNTTILFKELSIAIEEEKTSNLINNHKKIDEWLSSMKSNGSHYDKTKLKKSTLIKSTLIKYVIVSTLVGIIICSYFILIPNNRSQENSSMFKDSVLLNNKKILDTLPDSVIIRYYENECEITLLKEELSRLESIAKSEIDSIVGSARIFYSINDRMKTIVLAIEKLESEKINSDKLLEGKVITQYQRSKIGLINRECHNQKKSQYLDINMNETEESKPIINRIEKTAESFDIAPPWNSADPGYIYRYSDKSINIDDSSKTNILIDGVGIKAPNVSTFEVRINLNGENLTSFRDRIIKNSTYDCNGVSTVEEIIKINENILTEEEMKTKNIRGGKQLIVHCYHD